MSIKITDKETKFLAKILSKSLNGIDSIYKFEGYIVGLICSEETMLPSVFMKEMFGGPDDEDAMVWESLEPLNQFMEIYSNLNNKNALKLQSNIYRPIFAKTKEQVKEYAYGFRASYDTSHISVDGYKHVSLAYMIICSIYQADEKLFEEDKEYAKLIEVINNKPLLNLSESVKALNQFRLDNYVAPHDVKNNVLDFNDISSTHH